MFYLMMHLTHFIYGYMVSDIWLRTILIVRKEICCCHIGYSYQLTARVLLYAPSHRQDNTYHGLCYTSHGALAGTRNSPMAGRYVLIYSYPLKIRKCPLKVQKCQFRNAHLRFTNDHLRFTNDHLRFTNAHLRFTNAHLRFTNAHLRFTNASLEMPS